MDRAYESIGGMRTCIHTCMHTLSSESDISVLTCTMFFICFALAANRRVESVSAIDEGCGEHAATSIVFELPPATMQPT